MCTDRRDPAADATTYDRVEELVAALRPGMDLCTSDFTGWADIESMHGAGADAYTAARKRDGAALVHVPVNMVISIHHDTCVRIDRARATVDQQGWEVG